MNEIRHDDDGFLLPKKEQEHIEQILENTEKLLERHQVPTVKRVRAAAPVVRVNVKAPKATFRQPKSPKLPENSRPTPVQKREQADRTTQFRQSKIQTELLETIAQNGKQSRGSMARLLGLGAGLLSGLAKLPMNLAKGMLRGGKNAAIHQRTKQRGANGQFLPKGATPKDTPKKGGIFSKAGKLLKGVAKGGLIGAFLGLLSGAEIEQSDMTRPEKNKAHAKNAMIGVGGLGGAMAGAAIGSVVPVVGTIVGGILGGFGGAALMEHWVEWLDDRIPKNFSNRMFGSWDGFVGAIKDLWRGFIGNSQTHFANFVAQTQAAWQVFAQFATDKWTAFSGSLNSMASAVWETLVPQSFRTYFADLATWGKAAWDNVSSYAASFWESAKNIAQTAFDRVLKPIGDWAGNVYDKGQQLVQQGVDAWNNSTIGKAVNQGVGAVWDKGKAVVQQGAESAKNTAIDVKDWAIGYQAHVKGGRAATKQDEQKLLGELQNAKLIKSNEAIRGGNAHAGTYAAALDFRGAMGGDLKYFSAFNDLYHKRKSPNSTHTKGLALDIVNKSGSNKAAREQSQRIYDQLTKMGFKGKLATRENGKNVNIGSGSDFLIQDEYNRPSAKSSGGHIHFNWGSQEAANRYFAMTRGGAEVTIDTRMERATNAVQKGANFVAEKAVQGAGAIRDWVLGQTSKKYETGGKGAGTISSGKGDKGGVSYGSYQMSSNMGVVQDFVKKSAYASQFQGLQVNSEAFKQKWRELAKNDPNFAKAQHDYIQQTHYAPQMAKLRKNGMDFSQRGAAVQDAVWSTSVQFGGGTGLILNALKGKNVAQMSDNEIVTAIQDYKINNNEALFKSSSAGNRQGTLARAKAEKADLLKLINTPTMPTVQAAALPSTPKIPTPVAQPKPVAPPPVITHAAPAPVNPPKTEFLGTSVFGGSIAHKPSVSRTVNHKQIAHMASGGIMDNQV